MTNKIQKNANDLRKFIAFAKKFKEIDFRNIESPFRDKDKCIERHNKIQSRIEQMIFDHTLSVLVNQNKKIIKIKQILDEK